MPCTQSPHVARSLPRGFIWGNQQLADGQEGEGGVGGGGGRRRGHGPPAHAPRAGAAAAPPAAARPPPPPPPPRGRGAAVPRGARRSARARVRVQDVQPAVPHVPGARGPPRQPQAPEGAPAAAATAAADSRRRSRGAALPRAPAAAAAAADDDDAAAGQAEGARVPRMRAGVRRRPGARRPHAPAPRRGRGRGHRGAQQGDDAPGARQDLRRRRWDLPGPQPHAVGELRQVPERGGARRRRRAGCT